MSIGSDLLVRRYLETVIREDLKNKMVLIGGPRQVGKTTLAKMVGETFPTYSYMNWDHRPHRKSLIDGTLPDERNLFIFDEIHKYPGWKSLIKGIWDTRTEDESIIVTGSSKLDTFRRGGDSLLGRYHYFRLHPLSLKELNSPVSIDLSFPSGPPEPVFEGKGDGLEDLMFFGGFPEPFLSGDERTLKRWQKERFERVFREDIRESENTRSLAKVELLAELLPSRIGSTLSFNSLAEDLECSFKSVQNWMDLLCRNYYTFMVPPYHRRIERALKKSLKYYLWDWSEVEDRGARFENLVAVHLLKYLHFINDTHGISTGLFYLRDTSKREADFLITWEKEPWMIIEAKIKHNDNLTSLNYFADKLGVKNRFVVTLSEDKDHVERNSGVRVVPASRFLLNFV
jgi:predicted AAA+ superfamily ATPase